jgi:glycosyltransferase involved in cell wall biosynthesis
LPELVHEPVQARGRRDAEIRVLVLTPYPVRTAPSQRFRFEQYVEPLARAGIRIDISPFLDPQAMGVLYRPGHLRAKVEAVLRGLVRRRGDVAGARGYDLVLVHREALPLGYPVVERLLPRLGVPYVFDFDDAVYRAHYSAANSWIAPLKYPAKTSTIARGATLVVAGNEHLAAWARRYTDRVTVIPTTIDTDAYHPAPDGARRASERLCVGWSGSHSTVEHLKPLAPVLRDLQRERGVRLRVIGADDFRIPGAEVEALAWREATELRDLREIDIGIMPLPDDDWARGKCGLKALQYMALGIPTVMSPVGVNPTIARDGAALLASSPDDWGRVLRMLLDEPGLRERLAAAGRARVEEEYSIDAVAPAYVVALRGAARAAA